MGGKTVNLLEENIGEKFHDIGFGNDFLEIIPKAQAKEKINCSHQIKNFCAQKGTLIS